ncbi:MAG: peptidylprolyl isomerase [Caulobacteraceae bacterium]|nr:peptidylprolyl isomerase [Caulobacteraceae bacterium]
MNAFARRHLLALAAGLLALPALAQTPAPESASAAAPVPALPRVALETAEGRIVLELETAKAPVTARNFLRYVDNKRFDGAVFFRASKTPGAPQYGLLQGGLQGDVSRMYPPIAHEPTTQTGLKHLDGTISMGRFAPGTARADFFILLGDAPYLDADPKQPGDNQGFAAFGRVVEGMDVVKKIHAMPLSPTKGEGVMKGEILEVPVKIVSARRVG